MQSGRFSARTALAVVIANMIGTGVFTSLGFQLLEIRSGFVILALWFVGGVTALCGAVTYAELGGALPRSGGEYNFLSRTFHPAVGFVSGWMSATIGFAAPTALAAITFGTYLASVFPALSPRWMATGLIAALAAAHATTRRASGGTQRTFTYLKVVLIAVFCVLGWTLVETPQDIRFLPGPGDGTLLASGAFAVALIYVHYAYTGWNAATYVIDELDRPGETLSRVLLFGTGIVMALYLLLNFTFLHAAPVEALAGKLEVGYVAARFIFGDAGASIMGVVLALLLISTVSAMTLAGPRVLQVIGQDFRALRFLARTNRHDVPVVAIVLQSGLAVVIRPDGHLRVDPRVRRLYAGGQHAVHGRVGVRPAPAPSGPPAPVPRAVVPAATAGLPRGHGLDPHLHRAAAAGRGPRRSGDLRDRRRLLRGQPAPVLPQHPGRRRDLNAGRKTPTLTT